MKLNSITNQGIYLGTGNNPFPQMHCFKTTENGANKSFLFTLDGIVKISKGKFNAKEKSLSGAKEKFFAAIPNQNLD